MHLAYSALRDTEQPSPKNSNDYEIQLRYQAYLAACAKHQRYISEIQKHLPGWMPAFR